MNPSLVSRSSSPRRCAALAALAVSVASACASPPAPDSAAAPAERARAEQAELLRQSEAFARAGDGMRAEQYLALALDRGADSALVTRRLVDACVREQRYRAAAQYVERHLLRHPGDAELRFIRAVLLLGLDEPLAAARELEQLLAADARHAPAHFALGSLLREHLGDPLSADAHFRAYLELAPAGPYAERARRLTLRRVPTPAAELAPPAPAAAAPAAPPEPAALPLESEAPSVEDQP